MQYLSTRGRAPQVSGAEAVLTGLAPDGGLYLPDRAPVFDWRQCIRLDAMSMAESILRTYFPDIPHMDALVRSAYAGKFETDDLTPTVTVGDFTVLELFRGPTCAFKDVALSMLPRLMTAARDLRGEEKEILILTATSGDTGKAALVGFQDVPGIRICVFYPHDGVSEIQRRQMACQPGENVTVCAVKGNFDDAQSGVKRIFSTCRDGRCRYMLSSANSINIGRLVPQIMYYFKAYRDLLDRGQIELGQAVNFTVPTGNFGDILAGFLAKKLGLPVGKLICASNDNNVLTDFLHTGVYDLRGRSLRKTVSPSMDILISSNLERLLYLLSCDAELVDRLMAELSKNGVYRVPSYLLESIQEHFWGGYTPSARAESCIENVWRTHRYLCDPHTATGWDVACRYRQETGDARPMVVLSTASPYKFGSAVVRALGGNPADPNEFDRMYRIHKMTNVPIPENLAALRQMPVLHDTVIAKEEMTDFVLSL